jgi:hypothetical protein
MYRVTRTLFAILTAVAAAACGSDPQTTPTPPSVIITEPPFTGTLNPNGGITYPFFVTTFGTVTATIVALDPNPDNSVRVGLSLGTWNGSACQAILSNDNAAAGTALIGTVSQSGALCVRTYDAAGTLGEPVAFDISVTHP